MACAKPSDCAPCSKCPDSPQPVMPRCDVVLNDGVYANATIVVEDGCIIEINQGTPLLYQPDNNCAGAGGGGGGGSSLPGEQGEPGEAATVQIGAVFSLAPGAAPTVNNVGTPNHAILEIGIPRGEAGADAELPIGGAETNAAGMLYANGQLMNPLPAAWPPLLDIIPQPVIGAGVTLAWVKGADGIGTIELDLSGLINTINAELGNLASINAAQQLQIDDLLTRVAALEGP